MWGTQFAAEIFLPQVENELEIIVGEGETDFFPVRLIKPVRKIIFLRRMCNRLREILFFHPHHKTVRLLLHRNIITVR